MKLYANRVLPILYKMTILKYINIIANYLPTKETLRDISDQVSVLNPGPTINCPPGRLVPVNFWEFGCHQVAIIANYLPHYHGW